MSMYSEDWETDSVTSAGSGFQAFENEDEGYEPTGSQEYRDALAL